MSPKKCTHFAMSYLRKYWNWCLQIFYSNSSCLEIVHAKILWNYCKPKLKIFSPVVMSQIMSLIVSHTRKCKRISWKKFYDFWTQKSVSTKKRKITLTQLCLNLLYKVMLKQISSENINSHQNLPNVVHLIIISVMH